MMVNCEMSHEISMSSLNIIIKNDKLNRYKIKVHKQKVLTVIKLYGINYLK